MTHETITESLETEQPSADSSPKPVCAKCGEPLENEEWYDYEEDGDCHVRCMFGNWGDLEPAD